MVGTGKSSGLPIWQGSRSPFCGSNFTGNLNICHRYGWHLFVCQLKNGAKMIAI